MGEAGVHGARTERCRTGPEQTVAQLTWGNLIFQIEAARPRCVTNSGPWPRTRIGDALGPAVVPTSRGGGRSLVRSCT